MVKLSAGERKASPDRLSAVFDDEHAVAHAGLILTATLAQRLGIHSAADEMIDLGEIAGAAFPGRKLMTLIHAMCLGGDSIDDTDILRAGDTERVLGHRVMAPSTIGTFLRAFSFGHVRQLDRLSEAVLTRAWQAGAGPGKDPLVIDIDSSVCKVYGAKKRGASYGYSGVLGYHPIFATRADTGEVLHQRQRHGRANTARGAEHFIAELCPRMRRAGAAGPIVLRADSGFYAFNVFRACRRHNVRFSVTIPLRKGVRETIGAIDEASWVDIDYTERGFAQVAEGTHKGMRLVVRRTRLSTPAGQEELFPGWRHHAFVTDMDGGCIERDVFHRHHAVCELAIRELKAEGLTHTPSGSFAANSAWLAIAAMAHNLTRWVAALGLCITGPVVAQTIRRKYLALPGRITRSARRSTLRLPERWPWAHGFIEALDRLRAIPLRT